MFRLSIITALMLIVGKPLLGLPPAPQPCTEEESLLIRRIVDLWKDQEYAYVESHIKNYLKTHPQTSCLDYFSALLGDIALHNKNFEKALCHYNTISHTALKEYVKLKRWQALYYQQEWAELYEEISSQSDNLSEESKFYYAEASYRTALRLSPLEEGTHEAHHLFEKAFLLYSSLTQKTPFASHALLAMAEIYRHLNQQEKALELYLKIAEEETNREILFHVASVLNESGQLREKAEAILKKLAHEPGVKSNQAATQWFFLLAEKKDWKTIHLERELFAARLPKLHLPIYYFYLGFFNYEKKNYTQAIVDLQKSLKNNLTSEQEQKALIALLVCAKKLQKYPLCKQIFHQIENRFPEAQPEANLILASVYKSQGKAGKALAIYQSLIEESPSNPLNQKAAIKKIHLLMEKKEWSEAYSEVAHQLQHPDLCKKKNELMRLAIHLSLLQLSEKKVYAQLATDLERGLQKQLFYKEEKVEKELLLAKAYLKLGKWDLALKLLHEMDTPDPLLLAYCYVQEGQSPDKIIEFAEQALVSHPHEYALHMHLFNAYVDLAKANLEEDYSKKAAQHLLLVIDKYPTSLENKVWLVDYYLQEETEKAIPVLESFLKTEEQISLFIQEAYLLAHLYIDHQFYPQAEALLKKIIFLKPAQVQQAELKLADLYKLKEDPSSAKDLYQKLEDSADLEVAYTAKLQLARLEFKEHPEKSLHKLESLTYRKKLEYEPIHFEAALDFALFTAEITPSEEKFQLLLQLLEKIKKSYIVQEGKCAQTYHADRQLCPKKDLIFQAYMRYLDAQIYVTQAKLSENAQDKKTKLNAARALFSTLKHGKYAVTSYIKEKSAQQFYDF